LLSQTAAVIMQFFKQLLRLSIILLCSVTAVWNNPSNCPNRLLTLRKCRALMSLEQSKRSCDSKPLHVKVDAQALQCIDTITEMLCNYLPRGRNASERHQCEIEHKRESDRCQLFAKVERFAGFLHKNFETNNCMSNNQLAALQRNTTCTTCLSRKRRASGTTAPSEPPGNNYNYTAEH
jgi:hypothetical protein